MPPNQKTATITQQQLGSLCRAAQGFRGDLVLDCAGYGERPVRWHGWGSNHRSSNRYQYAEC
jgi:hypothetical protein